MCIYKKSVYLKLIRFRSHSFIYIIKSQWHGIYGYLKYNIVNNC